MRYYIISAIIFIGLSCQPKSESKRSIGKGVEKVIKQSSRKIEAHTNPVGRKAIYQFVNYIVKTEIQFPIEEEIVDQDIEPFDSSILLSKTLKKTVLPEDVEFMREQSKSIKDFHLSSKYIVGAKVISGDTIKSFLDTKKGNQEFWNRFEKKYGNRTFYSISMPLFSKDKSVAIARLGYHCNGTCGSGGLYIYKKVRKRWLKIETLETWIN
ncbi:hypothetical protein [Rubrolithibacter danxiaensis]|uniref:hypothetical protein n=1 Tax=Rubrolithibacter danxiaensis TaxID=3390805 RepID=UPI003BF8B68F